MAWLIGIALVCAGVFLYVSNAHADAQSQIAKANKEVDTYQTQLAVLQVSPFISMQACVSNASGMIAPRPHATSPCIHGWAHRRCGQEETEQTRRNLGSKHSANEKLALEVAKVCTIPNADPHTMQRIPSQPSLRDWSARMA